MDFFFFLFFFLFFFYGATTLIVLALSTIALHLERSCTCSAHSVSFIFFKLLLTSSSHLDLGLPAGLPFVYSFHYAGFGHYICVSKPTQFSTDYSE